MIKKLVLISLLSMSMLGFSHRKHSKRVEKPIPQLQIPRCKNTQIREQEWERYQAELRLKGYKILRAITSDTTFSVLVEDSNGNRKIEEKVWCSFD